MRNEWKLHFLLFDVENVGVCIQIVQPKTAMVHASLSTHIQFILIISYLKVVMQVKDMSSNIHLLQDCFATNTHSFLFKHLPSYRKSSNCQNTAPLLRHIQKVSSCHTNTHHMHAKLHFCLIMFVRTEIQDLAYQERQTHGSSCRIFSNKVCALARSRIL